MTEKRTPINARVRKSLAEYVLNRPPTPWEKMGLDCCVVCGELLGPVRYWEGKLVYSPPIDPRTLYHDHACRQLAYRRRKAGLVAHRADVLRDVATGELDGQQDSWRRGRVTENGTP